jgi:methionyl-tRNA synthetase
MSKSIGNVVDPNAIIEAYGADAFRFFVLREVPFGLDGDFSESAFITRFNTELANDLGNLLSRVLTMIGRYFEGKVPSPGNAEQRDQELRDIASGLPALIQADLTVLAFNKYLQDVWTLVTRANRYVEENAPWTLAKQNDMQRLGSVLYNLAESLRLTALYLFPVLPTTAQKIWHALGITTPLAACHLADEQRWGGLKPGAAVHVGEQLFPRIETDDLRRKKNREPAMEKTEEIRNPGRENEPAGPELIKIEDFAKVDLRVGSILAAERVEKSDKLVKLKVDIGTETRQVVAGIGKSYAPEDLVGKHIVIVTNLKPAKLVGVESQGMLLAASNAEGLSIITLDREIKPGSKVK